MLPFIFLSLTVLFYIFMTCKNYNSLKIYISCTKTMLYFKFIRKYLISYCCDCFSPGNLCERAPLPRPPFLQETPAPHESSAQEGARSSSFPPWVQVLGGDEREEGCGPKTGDGPVLVFDGDGPRLAVLREVDTRRIK